MAQVEVPAGECMHGRAVAGAVVGHHALDSDAVERIPGDCPLEKAGRGLAALVGEQLGVGEPGCVVDADVQVLPALVEATLVVASAADPAGHAVAWATDPAELLDIDMD